MLWPPKLYLQTPITHKYIETIAFEQASFPNIQKYYKYAAAYIINKW